MFGSQKKITKSENATVAGILQRPVAVAGFWRACLAGSGWIPAKFCQNLVCRHPATVAEFPHRHYSDSRMLSNSGAAWIPTTNYCLILAIGYQTCVQGRRV
jgi:hypothetical protein